MTGSQRRAGIAVAAVAAGAASAVLWNALPTNSDVYGPFDVPGTMGTPTAGRGIAATVTGVRLADVVEVPQPIAAIGRWVVVETEMEAVAATEYPHAELTVGPDTYAPTDRLAPGAELGEPIQPGIRTRGSWVFDVAPAALDSGQPLSLRLWVGDGRLDSRLVIAIDRGATAVGPVRVERPNRIAS